MFLEEAFKEQLWVATAHHCYIAWPAAAVHWWWFFLRQWVTQPIYTVSPTQVAFLSADTERAHDCPIKEAPLFDDFLAFALALGVVCGISTGSFISGAHIVDVLLTQKSCGAAIPSSFPRLFDACLIPPSHVAP